MKTQENTAKADTEETPAATPADIAHKANVTSRCVLNWYKRGLIPAEFHVGKVIRFNKEAVFEALRRQS